MADDSSTEVTFATDVFSLPETGGTLDDSYLLVLDGRSSRVFTLPKTGQVIIGRAKETDLHLDDTSVSRKHAQLQVVAGEAKLIDLGSQNGTLVNGEKITQPRALRSGDAITICATSLVFHAGGSRPRPRIQLEMDVLRTAVEGEVERAIAYQRPFALLAVGGTIPESVRWDIVTELELELRRIDRLAWSNLGHAFLLLPETAPDEVQSLALRVLDVVAPRATGAKVGYASCPRDGCDQDTLFASARSALTSAGEGEILSAEQAFRTLNVGNRSVVLADEAMIRLYALIERLAAADLQVLVTGETGTGKEMAAAAVHYFSRRRDKPLVTLNCAALQETLVESELFGHEKGAFTGAVTSKPGLLETATGGTVVLDEIGELSLGSQAKFLRVLETKRFTRLGDVKEREVDVRFVAATNRDLQAEVAKHTFREDLYFRLSAATVWLPPLRDRKREIPILAQTFLAQACQRSEKPAMTLAEDAIQSLLSHPWPGNIRELKNAIEYLAAAATNSIIEGWQVDHQLGRNSQRPVPAATPTTDEPDGAEFKPIKDELQQLERTRIEQALKAADGNQTKAAALIKMPLRTFVARLKKYDIR